MAEDYEKAEKDYLEGAKYKDIAAKYGVTINTVKSWKVRYGWSRGGEKGGTQNAHKNQKSVHTKKRKLHRCNQSRSKAIPAEWKTADCQRTSGFSASIT